MKSKRIFVRCNTTHPATRTNYFLIFKIFKLYPMKNLLFVLSVLVLVSCGQHKKEIARMQSKQDSIAQLGVQKDNSILEFIGAMNEIQMNLDSIKNIEKIVSVQTAPGVELKAEAKNRIIEDIAQINNLLQKNKELVKSLQGKLRASNVKIAELENMISLLNKQLGEKDVEIAEMKAELENLHVNVAGLNQKIETITKESEKTIKAKNQAIQEQTIALNTAFYAFGTKKELEEKNVIEKEGGVLGMGKTIKMKKDFNRDYFMKIDIREFNQLTINSKKAKIITTHPADSYHLTGVKTVESLVIDKPEEFWKASKYLLIVVE
jgi:phosphate uptake regulator